MTQLPRQKRLKFVGKKPPTKSARKAEVDSGSRLGPTSIMDLPDDCLYYIFQRLACKSERDSFGLTCLCWLQIQNLSRQSLTCSVFMSRRLSLSPITGTQPPLDRLLNRFYQLQSLSLPGYEDNPNSLLSQLQHHGSKLHALDLNRCEQLSDYGLYLVAAYCPSLTALYLNRCSRITDHGLYLLASGCPSLTDIILCWCNVTDVGLEVLSKSCLALKNVKLLHCKLISDHGISALSRNCSQLRFVCVSMCNITGVGFKGCSKTLACLDAADCNLEPEGIQGIVSGGGLKYLNVSFTRYCLGGDGLGAIGSSGFAKRLTILDFRMCKTVNDEAVVAVAKGCPLLQEWSLVSCHEVKLLGWESVGSNCCNLERVHVNRCSNLCDQGLQALRDGCKRLTILHISECDRISSTAMEVFQRLRHDVEIKEEVLLGISPSWLLDEGG